MTYAVLIDFGSTYTKVVCVDLNEKVTVLTDRFPSTVNTDAGIALNKCFDAVIDLIGKNQFDKALKLASSSAAGGLRLAVSGLTRSLSNAAGRNACFSAGGKLVHTSWGRLDEGDIEAIQNSKADIVLLCGGYEDGNTELIQANAKILSESSLKIPVIYSGNSKVSQSIRYTMTANDKTCFLAENIIPEVGKMNLEPTADIIRHIFITQITNMKGVGKVASSLDGAIVPTPAAVLKAGELLSRGTENSPGIGDFIMVDVGGATTDIYSFANNTSYEGAKMIGLNEPFAKRTVEGDLGMRESAGSLAEEIGIEKFAEDCNLTVENAKASIEFRNENRAFLAENSKEKQVDDYIAKQAIAISARRHAGYVEKGFMGEVSLIQYGKNLTEVDKVIGTGGIIVNAENPKERLNAVNVSAKETGRVLLPAESEAFVDRDYVFFAAGLLAEEYPETAIEIMKKSIDIDH